MKTIAVGGGFDPLHVGHLHFLRAARKRADRLIVLLEGDEWVADKRKPLMPQADRAAILRSLREVGEVVCLREKDACAALWAIRPDYFGVGRDHADMNFPEAAVCKKAGIAIAVIGHGREEVRSSLLLAAQGAPQWINPPVTVDALIIRDGKLLLTRRGSADGRGLLDLPGGFLDQHETLEEALCREVREELGVELAASTYFGSWVGFYSDGRQLVCCAFLGWIGDEQEPKLTDETSEIIWADRLPDEPFFTAVCQAAAARFFRGAE